MNIKHLKTELVKMRVEWLVSAEFLPMQDAVDCAGDLGVLLRELMTGEEFKSIAESYTKERRKYYARRYERRHNKALAVDGAPFNGAMNCPQRGL